MISKKFLEKFRKSDTIVVAFSGGPDSVFLAEQLQKNNYKNIILAHFNHHMDVRKGANNLDEIFVKCPKT
jgi:tRNA(Ile)-lysidine synthase TilS/MesJ